MKAKLHIREKACLSLLFSLIFSLAAVGINAGEIKRFPNKPISLIVLFSAGSGADTDVRLIQPYLQQHLGARVIVNNIPGAGGRLGLTKVYKAPPDGYTICSTGWAAGAIIPEILFKPEFKTLDFTNIGAWSGSNFVLVVNSETWKTMEEFVQAAKSRKLSCGISGIASAVRILGEALLEVTGIKEINWVAYSGGAESMAQLAGKHLDLVITSTSSAMPLVRAGKVRPLMVFADEKDDVFPNAPLTKELGYPIQPLPSYRALFGPPKLPPAVVRVIADAMVKASNESEYRKKMKDRGLSIQIMNDNELKKSVVQQFNAIQKYISRIQDKSLIN